ncbi:hypothetical protein HA402_004576 [Bradysia odoriphaga]|nr:hypothetical protein HA402_004576 [Bradysia odoriphaga]
MKDFFSRTLLDSIASCAFGLKVDSFEKPENEFFINSKIAVNLSTAKQFFKIVLMSNLPSVASAFGISLMDRKVESSFQSTVLDTMKIRKAKNIVRPDMINLMMELRKGTLNEPSDEKVNDTEGYATVQEIEVGKTNVNRTLNDDEITAQCFIFLAGGFEATSNVLMFASYELMTNPDLQQKLYEEIVETNRQLGGKRINYDELQKMKYLDQVVSETLRKWPPASSVDRVCGRDYVLRVNDSVTVNIEKGSICLLPIYGIHYDPKYFPEPEKFYPERFSDENKRNIVSGSFIPFGLGPRNCIGSRFALMEVKAVLYYLLLKFSFEPNEKTEIPLKLKKVLTAMMPENGLHLELKPRKN